MKPLSWGLLWVYAALSGCAVGPDFKAPPLASSAGYRSASEFDQAAQSASNSGTLRQQFRSGQDLPAQWWTLFESAALNGLIEEALVNNPNLESAQAALRQAQQDLNAARGVLFPAVDGSGTAIRQKTNGAALGLPAQSGFISNIFDASVKISYNFDIFGGERRAIEAAAALVDLKKFELEASYLTLTANVVATALQIAAVHEQIAATENIIVNQQQQIALVERQLQLGSATRADWLAAQAQLQTVRATLPALTQNMARAQHQLAALTGYTPAELRPLELALADLKLPTELPISLPSALVQQRPDIRAQEALLHAACAQIGVATANLLPQLALSGSYGGLADRSGDVFDSSALTWSMAAGITQPIFHGGSLRAKRRAAIARYEQSAAAYRQTVLHAFQEVADSLSALDSDAQALMAQTNALQAAQDSLELRKKQHALGAIDSLTLLVTQTQYQQARIGYAQASARRYVDTAVLLQALGGGWWNREHSDLHSSVP